MNTIRKLLAWFKGGNVAPEMGMHVLEDMRRLVVAPGDVLVLMPKGPMHIEQRESMREWLGRTLPDVKVLVLEGGMRIGVIAQKDEPRVVVNNTVGDVLTRAEASALVSRTFKYGQ